jgi:ABC-type transport system substrate-binding protein
MVMRMVAAIVVSIALCACAPRISLAQPAPTPRGEIRVVDKDALNWGLITWQVFEHLVEFEGDGTLAPRLAASWRWLDERTVEFKLRKGVKFQNGESFDAEIVKLNWEENTRYTQPHLPGTWLNFKPGSTLEVVDRETVRFQFPEPDGAALVKIGAMHIGNREFYKRVGWGEKHW